MKAYRFSMNIENRDANKTYYDEKTFFSKKQALVYYLKTIANLEGLDEQTYLAQELANQKSYTLKLIGDTILHSFGINSCYSHSIVRLSVCMG